MRAYDYHHLNHVKEQQTSRKTLWFVLLITVFFTIVEIVGGLLSNSLALLSDSAHMISDVFALTLSLIASYLARRPPNQKFTFGYLRFEIVASFLNGLVLLVIAIGIFIEAIRRLIQPQEIQFSMMFIIAIIGLIANVILTIILSHSSRKEDNLNIKSALWHFIGDLLNSIGIIISSGLIYVTGYYIFDPLISMLISGIIFIGGAKITRESYLILMESVPDQFHLDSIRKEIASVEGVKDVHEFHLWAISTNHYSLTAHVFVREDVQPLLVIKDINQILNQKYGIKHSTIQTEHPAINDHGEYGRKFQKDISN